MHHHISLTYFLHETLKIYLVNVKQPALAFLGQSLAMQQPTWRMSTPWSVYGGGGISSHWVTFISPLYCSFGGINSMKYLLRCTYQDLTVHKQEIGSFYSQIFEAFKSNSRKFDAWHLFLQTWKFSYLSAIMLWKTFVKYSYIYYN